jgi:hypothetical protein
MHRITRRIGLFGGPGALIPATGARKKPVPAPSEPTPSESDPGVGTGQGESTSPPAPKKSWRGWLRGSKKDPGA